MRFAQEAAAILAKPESEIERSVYLAEVSRMTGVEESAIRREMEKLTRKEEEAFRKDAERRQQNLRGYQPEERKAEKGLMEAQRNLLYYAAQQQTIFEALRGILEPEDFTEEVYRRAFAQIGALWERIGTVFPADLVGCFEELKEQKAVTEIFAMQLPMENGADLEKALNEQVKRVKHAGLDRRIAGVPSAEEMQRLILAKSKLDSLYITI